MLWGKGLNESNWKILKEGGGVKLATVLNCIDNSTEREEEFPSGNSQNVVLEYLRQREVWFKKPPGGQRELEHDSGSELRRTSWRPKGPRLGCTGNGLQNFIL